MAVTKGVVGKGGVVATVKSPEEELLNLLATQARQLPLAIFGVLVLVAALISSYSTYGWAIWLAAVIAVLALRFAVLTRLPGMTDWSLDARLRIALVLSGVNGIVHASSLYYFPLMTGVERASQSLILAGLAVAAIATTAGDRRIYLAYMLPIFPALVVLWATSGNDTVSSSADVGLALAIFVFAIVLVMLARDTNHQFNQTIRIRKEQEELNRQLQKALQDAAVADRAKTRFLASASHDLRQPIHALSLFGAALKMQELPDDVRDLANNIDESITVLASQLDSLLDISRLDAGVVTPEFVVIDLTSMLRRIGREFEQLALEKGLALNLELEGDYHIISDKLLLERVIRNLLNNAVRYTETGRITIEASCDASQCCLAISDTGIGIEESEQANVFSEFYQVSQEYGSSKQGLGLGLSIVARLLSLLGAPMTLRSAKGEGTRIEISLTLEADRKEAREVSGKMRLEGVSVLVIDDDVAVRKAMIALLGNHGAEVRVAADVGEAMALAAASAPDVVVSDLRLGIESGIDAIARIRDICGDLPAILITGDTSAEQIQLAHESGLVILHKPVDVADLEKAIAEAVSHHRS